MCDILFSQVCLKVPPASSTQIGEGVRVASENNKKDLGEPAPPHENCLRGESMEEVHSRANNNGNFYHGTASMAALLLQGRAVVPMQLVARVPAALFYWPLIQLASAATDNIALGVAVGSKGRGNLPGAGSDIRATLLLLLIGKCTVDPSAFEEVGGEEFFR